MTTPSKAPNLQNIPLRTEAGREIKKMLTDRARKRISLEVDFEEIERRFQAAILSDTDEL